MTPGTLARALGMALDAVLAFRLRTLFVSLAVAFGIAALTLIVTAVDGANRMAYQIVDMFGPDAALIFGGNIKKRAVGERTLTLTAEDARRIRRSLPGVYLVTPMRAKFDVTARYEGRTAAGLAAVGALEDYTKAWNWPLAEGRDFTPEDVERAAKVCLLGDKPARTLFGDESPVGRTIFLNNVPLLVVGKLAYRGFSGGGGGREVDDRVILPLPTLTNRFNLDRKFFVGLRVKFSDATRMESQVAALKAMLRELHHLPPEADDDFTVLTADEVLAFLAMLKGGLMVFLGVTAVAALAVGGFVLANLFALSVTERSSEIGLKRALGARSSAVLAQFLFEAVILTLAGGILGLFLGLSLGQLLTRLEILTIQFSWKVFIMALGGSLIVGLVFGLKPARQAAALDPVEALRGGG
ncbi:MAG: ABC transporter permease [Desulfovibrio aminophilus]|uniref:ABC transporter permease n=1 Tax=Desulfovibrio aminophilus TaxID=81425 RepID=UPI002A385A41|nr:ABC transporter permease [Desulfovibrionaceae bacterium]